MTPRGRPPVGRTVNVRMPDDLIADLDRASAHLSAQAGHKVNRAETVRVLLAWALSVDLDNLKREMGL
jgi:hypothetical protein